MTARLRIAVIAHVRHPIAAPFMGGMEMHCDLLVRGLVEAGHDVTLFASGESSEDLPLHPIAPHAYERILPWARWSGRPELREWLLGTYQRCWALIRAGGFDIVHNNSLFPDLHEWAARDQIAMLTSLHVPPFRMLCKAIERTVNPSIRFTVPSANQRALWPQIKDDRIDVAWNGIDLRHWPFQTQGNRRAVWFGRITPNKGTVEALRAATAAAVALDVIGPIECGDYFSRVEPFITGPHRYLGQLSGGELAKAVGSASVMVATPMWDEPFGLTLAEAMACGVPVAALDRGAIREVIGATGEIARHVDLLPEAIRRAMTRNRHGARTRVERLFTVEAMVRRYERAYAAALTGAASTACASSTRSTERLLA
ncbi:MAG: glycosyltransferase [Sphingorhabdus sp.]